VFSLQTSIATPMNCINCDLLKKKISNDDKGIPLIAWDTVYFTKNLGELGLRRTYPVNKAFITKLIYKLEVL